MEKPIDHFWKTRFKDVRTSLVANNFDVYLTENTDEAKKLVMDDLIPQINPKSISWGGSMTYTDTSIYTSLKDDSRFEIIDTFDKSLSDTEKIEVRRKSLLVDLFITGTNAITINGQLVNLDMIGNRVAAITFGPKSVIILAGRNKIVSGLDEARDRIKRYAAPANAMRLDKKTPCVKTACCVECDSPDRICNYWTITDKSFPKGRIKIVLINENLGI